MTVIITTLFPPLGVVGVAGLGLLLLFLYNVSHIIGNYRMRLPPGPRRWPVFGNLLEIGAFPHKDFARFCKKYGPLVYLRLGTVHAITTDDPDVIREILVRQDDVFASRPQTLAAMHLTYGSMDVAMASFGPHWKRMRRICMEHLLTTKRLESFAHHRTQEAAHLVRIIWERRSTQAINLREVLNGFSMNNVTRMLFGKQYYLANEDSAGNKEAVEFMAITHQVFELLGLIYVGDYIPAWRWVDPYGCEKIMREIERKIDDFHSKIIEQHRNQAASSFPSSSSLDFVDVLLSLPGKDGRECMDDKEIKAVIQDMIAAAMDTSSVTNEWVMTEVIKNPNILRKIQQELDDVVGRDRMVKESDIQNLNYLRCVVRETFRLHPPGPFVVPHESMRPTKILGYDIPSKTRVFINSHALGRNKRIWNHDVEMFFPERHLIDGGGGRVEISHGNDFKIVPFGAGKRKCPGAPLGLVFVLFGLATLFHSFDWFPPEGVTVDDINTSEVYGMTMPKKEPLLARAIPRLAPHLYF